MKYNKEGEFDVYELFSNEKYRARLVLGFYAILIAILVISLRTGSSSNNVVKDDNPDKEPVETEKKEENDEGEEGEEGEEAETPEETDKFEKKFVYLLQNNYEFDYKLIMDSKTIASKGKRTDKEILFDVTSSDEKANCYGVDDTLKCNPEGKYQETDYPYFFFNYYDPEEIIEILKESKYNKEDNKYHIDNATLYYYGDGSMDFSKVDKIENVDNTIELIEKNEKVVGIKMDFSNLFNNEDTGLEKVLLELNYSNFGFVDDITPPKDINK